METVLREVCNPPKYIPHEENIEVFFSKRVAIGEGDEESPLVSFHLFDAVKGSVVMRRAVDSGQWMVRPSSGIHLMGRISNKLCICSSRRRRMTTMKRG